ncbi:MAG: carboxypeptidase-like regulatory domain-containing protein [Cytophagales bacterium]
MNKILQTFILLLTVVAVYAQDKTITGTVTDKLSGAPMPGVNISVKGTSAGTQTDGNGQYKLNEAKPLYSLL